MSSPPEGRSRRCPICDRPQDAKFRPFCSRRCAEIDLARWLDGRYAIPVAEEAEGAPKSNGAEDGGGDPD